MLDQVTIAAVANKVTQALLSVMVDPFQIAMSHRSSREFGIMGDGPGSAYCT
jgi:hypothetical protein